MSESDDEYVPKSAHTIFKELMAKSSSDDECEEHLDCDSRSRRLSAKRSHSNGCSRRTKAKESPPKPNVIVIGSDDDDDDDVNDKCNQDTNLVKLDKSSKVAEESDADCEVVGDESFSNDVDLSNMPLNIIVKWMGTGIVSYKLRRFEPFKHVYEALAKDKDIDVSKIFLSRGNVRIRHSDTPDSIKLHILDIFTGEQINHSLKYLEEAKKEKVAASGGDADTLSFTVLTEGLRRNKRVFELQKRQRMEILYLKIAEHLECSVEEVTLYFDGEKINPKLLPVDLDLEGGECIELKTTANVDLCWDDNE